MVATNFFKTPSLPSSPNKKQNFLVKKACLHKQGLILKLEGISTFQQALVLKKAFVFVPKKLFHSTKGDNIYLCEVLNFKVFNVSKSLALKSQPTNSSTTCVLADTHDISKHKGAKLGSKKQPTNSSTTCVPADTHDISKHKGAKLGSKKQPTNSSTTFVLADSAYLGEVFAFSHNGAQDLLKIKDKNRPQSGNQANNWVIEVPFISEFILKVDFRAKKIYTYLPEGFIPITSEVKKPSGFVHPSPKKNHT